MGSLCSADVAPVWSGQSGGLVLVGRAVGPVLVGPVLVGPVLVGPGPVGPVLVGPVGPGFSLIVCQIIFS